MKLLIASLCLFSVTTGFASTGEFRCSVNMGNSSSEFSGYLYSENKVIDFELSGSKLNIKKVSDVSSYLVEIKMDEASRIIGFIPIDGYRGFSYDDMNKKTNLTVQFCEKI